MATAYETREAAQDRGKFAEGGLARPIEEYTARLPSDLFLWAAGASMLTSLCFLARGDNHKSLFVGQWVPSFLLLGVYDKIVKVGGKDKYTP